MSTETTSETDSVETFQREDGKGYSLYRGDCVEVMKSIPDSSIDMCIHSPPFSNLYIYSDHESDMGNCADDSEFITHYKFLIAELFRTIVTGRIVAVHCKDLPKYANRDGTAGLIDFPGMIIQAYEDCGFSFHSRVTVWKCPVTERERTNNNGLLHKTILRDRSQVRQGMADYMLMFRKPPIGTLMSEKPVIRDNEPGEGLTRFVGEHYPFSCEHPSPYSRKKMPKEGEHSKSIAIWQRYAEPVWWDISQTRVLNFKIARDEKDERHICPLQLDVIERCIQLWSNPGDIVLTPFMGIGSEVYVALKTERKAVGIELKESYFQVAKKNAILAVAKAGESKLQFTEELKEICK